MLVTTAVCCYVLYPFCQTCSHHPNTLVYVIHHMPILLPFSAVETNPRNILLILNCPLSWLIAFLAQLNPLVGPNIPNAIAGHIRRAWLGWSMDDTYKTCENTQLPAIHCTTMTFSCRLPVLVTAHSNGHVCKKVLCSCYIMEANCMTLFM